MAAHFLLLPQVRYKALGASCYGGRGRGNLKYARLNIDSLVMTAMFLTRQI